MINARAIALYYGREYGALPVRGVSLVSYQFNGQDNAQAEFIFQLAVSKDPTFARAYAGLSFVHFQTAFLRNTQDVASEADLAQKFTERAMDRDPLDLSTEPWQIQSIMSWGSAI